MIDSKAKMYELYRRGAFGNMLRSFIGNSTGESWDLLWKSGYDGELTARSVGLGGGGFTMFRIPNRAEALNVCARFVDARLPGHLVFNESAPDDLLLIQGEVSRSDRGLVLRYNAEPGLKMREAMENACHAFGLVAQMILRRKLTPASLADIEELLDLYPDHVVEFSVYDKHLGNCPARNTVIWEVRNY